MKKMGKIVLGILLVFCVIAGGSVAFADDSTFTNGIQSVSQLDNEIGQKLGAINNDSSVSQYKDAFQAASDNYAKELQTFDSMSSSTDDQNVKDYITIQKDRVTASKQMCDRMVELCSDADKGSLTYSNLKNSDDTIKTDMNTINEKEKATAEFLNSHTDVKDKINQASVIGEDLVGNSTV